MVCSFWKQTWHPPSSSFCSSVLYVSVFIQTYWVTFSWRILCKYITHCELLFKKRIIMPSWPLGVFKWKGLPSHVTVAMSLTPSCELHFVDLCIFWCWNYSFMLRCVNRIAESNLIISSRNFNQMLCYLDAVSSPFAIKTVKDPYQAHLAL